MMSGQATGKSTCKRAEHPVRMFAQIGARMS
jgi:hypothetical protein